MPDAKALAPEVVASPAEAPLGSEQDDVTRRIMAAGHASIVTAALMRLQANPDLTVTAVSAEYGVAREHLRTLAIRYGVAPPKGAALTQARRLAYRAGLLAEDKLEEGKIDIPAMTAWGIATDKISKLEPKAETADLAHLVAELAATLEPGESVSLELALHKRGDPEQR